MTSVARVQTLSSSGSFTGTAPLTLTANNTVGTFTDNGDGTWELVIPDHR